MGRLEGRVALVTGAARGQGRNHARRLAEEGADIIAVDLCAEIESVPYPLSTPDDLEQTVEEVESLGRRIGAVQADVRDLAAMRDAVDRGVDELGRLDVVVANAGILSIAHTLELEESAWRDMIDVNLTGVWITAKAAIPHMIDGGRGGSIILISSISGLVGVPNVGHYVAAKHGVVGLMRTLANELAEHAIRVNAVNPTNVDTPMIQNRALRRLFVPDSDDPTDEQFRAASLGMNAMPVPWVEMDDVSDAVLFLASDESRYITGVALPVDAGYVAKA